ncbi:MAG: response regulator, partial [Bacteroidota bacterium]
MNVLVVDDEPIAVASICQILRDSALVGEVFTAASGQEMLERCRSYPIDLILLDIMMPSMDGLSALAEARRIDPDILGLIVSAHEDFFLAQRAIRLGAVDYLLKPVSSQTLLAALERVVRHLAPKVPAGVDGSLPLPPPRPLPNGGPIGDACAILAQKKRRHS